MKNLGNVKTIYENARRRLFHDVLLYFWLSSKENFLHCELFGVKKIVKQNLIILLAVDLIG